MSDQTPEFTAPPAAVPATSTAVSPVVTTSNPAAAAVYQQIESDQAKARRRKRIICWIAGIIAMLALVLGVIWLLNKWNVTVELHGAEREVIEYGQTWTDSGASASYTGSIFQFIGSELPVETTGSVDSKHVGEYKISYSAEVYGIKNTATRVVQVRDSQQPQLQLVGGEKIKIELGGNWKDEFLATDNADGDLTAKVTVDGQVDVHKAGDYELRYTVRDASGNTATASRKVSVVAPPPAMADPAAGKDKVIYLTFDDGPSPHTARLLDALQARNVKATFFVTGNSPQEMIAREAREGHAIGVHTYSHDYAKIYASEAAYWADFAQMSDVIKAQTGKAPVLMRFPGGSSNTVSKHYAAGIMTRLAQQASEKGYVYFDWNVSSGDAGENTDKNSVLAALKAGVQGKRVSNVLCHDSHGYTVDAIPEFVDWALANGYTFLPLAPGSFTAHHGIAN